MKKFRSDFDEWGRGALEEGWERVTGKINLAAGGEERTREGKRPPRVHKKDGETQQDGRGKERRVKGGKLGRQGERHCPERKGSCIIPG